MNLYVIRRHSWWKDRYALAVTTAKWAKIAEQEMPDRVRWIRSYVVKEPDGLLGTVCIYEAQDEGSLREHAMRVGMPGDDIFPLATTIIARPDP